MPTTTREKINLLTVKGDNEDLDALEITDLLEEWEAMWERGELVPRDEVMSEAALLSRFLKG